MNCYLLQIYLNKFDPEISGETATVRVKGGREGGRGGGGQQQKRGGKQQKRHLYSDITCGTCQMEMRRALVSNSRYMHLHYSTL